MDIVIAANFCREFLPSDNSRFVYLARELSREHEVELITSDFLHVKKEHRGKLETEWPFQITFVHEPGYKKNISPKRFWSHRILGDNLYCYLKQRKKPDVIYCAVPSLDFAWAAARYAKENGTRFIVDIQDLWPEAFQMALPIPALGSILFWPLARQADRIYQAADHIVAVSETYAQRGRQADPNAKTTACYLGTSLEQFDTYTGAKESMDNPLRVVYIGTLAHSYDLETVMLAIAKLKSEREIEFLVMGDGVLREQMERRAAQLKLNAVFTGRLPYDEMVKKLTMCDIAVNPIKRGSAASIINKVGDYAMAGLPVINSQECEEYRVLLEDYRAGINCAVEDVEDFQRAIRRLAEDADMRWTMGLNSRKLGQERFDRKYTYQKLIRMIEAG